LLPASVPVTGAGLPSALVDSQHSGYSRSGQMKIEFVTEKVSALFFVFHVRIDSSLGPFRAIASLLCEDDREQQQSGSVDLAQSRLGLLIS
jgi:hypothetical protein